MASAAPLRVIILKPSKYRRDGYVERFRWGFMPNSTVPYMKSLTPDEVDGSPCEVLTVDEYVQTDLDYLGLLERTPGRRTLLALVGVQSHQFQRALDLAALARSRGVESCVVGGPHPMTCDVSAHAGRGVSFAQAEAEIVWPTILRHAREGELLPVYGEEGRWQARLDPPVLVPPAEPDLRRYATKMLGIYPARGCPYVCNFCSVIKIAGRAVRSQPVETTLASLKAAKAAGVKSIMFTSDNFNKYPEVRQLLERMIEEEIRLPFFVQCDAQIYRQEELVALMARAGCYQMFIGVESFSREVLREAHKLQNHPDRYAQIAALCRRHGILTHFSNIIGFPSHTEESVLEHLELLREVGPDLASFYVLCPIPGTEQYEDFLAQELITDRNLDRFDTTCVTWRHPVFDAQRWNDLVYRCYREFFRGRDVVGKMVRRLRPRWDYRTVRSLLATMVYSCHSRITARQRSHPMAGGAARVFLDRAEDYARLRRRLFDCDLVPLPKNLALSRADEQLNRHAKLPQAV